MGLVHSVPRAWISLLRGSRLKIIEFARPGAGLSQNPGKRAAHLASNPNISTSGRAILQSSTTANSHGGPMFLPGWVKAAESWNISNVIMNEWVLLEEVNTHTFPTAPMAALRGKPSSTAALARRPTTHRRRFTPRARRAAAPAAANARPLHARRPEDVLGTPAEPCLNSGLWED